MSSREKRLNALRREAEAAAGVLIEEATLLEELADLLPDRQKDRQVTLRRCAGRLTSAAHSLTAEVAASNPSTARKAVEIARSGLISVGLVLAGGAADGSAAALTERALVSHADAVTRCEAVIQEARVLEAALRDEVDTDIESLRQAVIAYRSRVDDPAADKALSDNGIAAPDLGVPNARQRLVYLNAALEQLWRLWNQHDRSDELWQERDRLRAELDRVRELVEVLAESDDSLYPPQHVSADHGRYGAYSDGYSDRY